MFISPDSIVPDLYDPQALNRFAYARNNPIKYTDPSGHYWDKNENSDDVEYTGPSEPDNFNDDQDKSDYYSEYGYGLVDNEGNAIIPAGLQSDIIGDIATFAIALAAVTGVPQTIGVIYATAAASPAWASFANNIGAIGHRVGQGSRTWFSPAGGRQFIQNQEFTIHALERMAPKGLIQKGTEIVSRGVPPSVVENAIKFGAKSTGNSPPPRFIPALLSLN